MILNTLLF